MGSGGSKGSCRGGGSSSSGGRKGRSIGKNRVFQSSCLGAPSGSADSHFDRQVVVVDHHNKDYGSNFANQNRSERESESDQEKRKCSRKVKAESASGYEMPLPCISSNGVDIDASRSGSSSGRATTAVHHSPSRCLSGFSFFPDTDRERDRRVGVGSRESVERNVRFSRTLSVGRLRDRVLRRPSLSNFTLCPLQQNGQVGSQTHAFRGDRDTRQFATSRSTSTSVSGSAHTTTVISHTPVFNILGHEVETSQSREARYHDLLEHRSNFLERRRRIRSQVRALRRLGSHFENSGHERSCILSGLHRTGGCTCRVNNRDSNSNDETSASASLSRIVMLAEALFEVLDEIHQQSVVLSSRPSVSSIGSVPAPNEVVELLPVKIYNKSHKLHNDEAGQCYICLLEYEEGDSMRILPCNHEFHRTCIDKWLKEVHRHDLLAVN
ncbi:hypothetical protein ES319_A03G000200v1 [Gossypium barbadense]|uniref:RING-type domain-containing protein n=2 Tax=Gossypium barbadense TaxID=3634 RepID=A0A5J5W7L1_GOSBA|nr:hypothetical protein ES319_A03G000200v1 [Gossypium barbadense]